MSNKGFFDNFDKNIFYKRKKGYSLREIWMGKQSMDTGEDSLLALNHCVRVCYENDLPFSTFQIKRVFNEVFNQKHHGSKVLSWNFIKKWSGKKLVKFEAEVKSKVPSSPIELSKLSPVTIDNNKKVQSTAGDIK